MLFIGIISMVLYAPGEKALYIALGLTEAVLVILSGAINLLNEWPIRKSYWVTFGGCLMCAALVFGFLGLYVGVRDFGLYLIALLLSLFMVAVISVEVMMAEFRREWDWTCKDF